MHGSNGLWHSGSMGLWWIVGAALVVLVAWLLIRSARGPRSGSRDSPVRQLKQRYARGEIDSATYQRMLSELDG